MPILGIIYDAEADLAVLQFGDTVLSATIAPIKHLKKDAKEVAEFCAGCAKHGGVVFPVGFEVLAFAEAEKRIQEFVLSCASLLEDAVGLAAAFPLKIGPAEGYVNAATRGKLSGFDLAAKAIVDEYSCGGFITGWKADDAYSALIAALETFDWDLATGLMEARSELGMAKAKPWTGVDRRDLNPRQPLA